MARLEDEGWSFIEVSGSAMVLVVGDWLYMTCSGTTSSGKVVQEQLVQEHFVQE